MLPPYNQCRKTCLFWVGAREWIASATPPWVCWRKVGQKSIVLDTPILLGYFYYSKHYFLDNSHNSDCHWTSDGRLEVRLFPLSSNAVNAVINPIQSWYCGNLRSIRMVPVSQLFSSQKPCRDDISLNSAGIATTNKISLPSPTADIAMLEANQALWEGGHCRTGSQTPICQSNQRT